MGNFYNGTKLLSLKDLNGNTPEIFMCTSNRSAGKTTFFSRLFVNKFLRNNEKFALLYRYKYELDSVADKFFKDIKNLFFNDYDMKSETRSKGVYHELFIKNIYDEDVPDSWLSCGYALAINSADQIKKISHLLSDVKRMMMDEFQSESNTYCDKEITKFISIHNSIARGGGKQSRYLPIIMLSNPVSIINPYYVEMGISNRLNNKVKFLRGNGWVLEQGYNESANKAQKQSSFNSAFEKNDYINYSANGVYLNDNLAFIEKPKGEFKYIVTLKYGNNHFAIKEFLEQGIIYCDDKADLTFPNKIAVTTEDHNINYVMLKNNDYLIQLLRFYFERGIFRFKTVSCKEVILKMLSY